MTGPLEAVFTRRAELVSASCLRWTVVVAFLLGNVAPALAAPSSPAFQARDHFDRGLELVRDGDLCGAIEAFEAAHRASPHVAVLYNLGQAYAAVGRSLDAVRVLEVYLAEAGDSVSAHRRQAVTTLVARERSRLATIDVVAQPSDATLSIDGKVHTLGPRATFVLDAGHHVIHVSHPRHVSRILTLDLAPGEQRRVELALDESPRAEVADGVLIVTCDTPGVRIDVDEHERGVTPLDAPLVLTRGRHVVRFTRHGYAPAVRWIAIEPSRTARIGCHLAMSPEGLVSAGRLRVQTSEPQAAVTVDGKSYHGELLAPGPHALKVERDGFMRHHQTVTIDSIGSRTVTIRLRPTQNTLREQWAAVRSRRIWAVASGAIGVALGAASITTAVWNDGRYQSWRRDRDQFEEAVRRGQTPSDIFARSRALNSTAVDIRRVDDVVLGLGLAATGALITASVLWLSE